MAESTKKKLAAIMFSKFVEFEKYLAEDESFAVKILSDHDKYLDEQINLYSGRVIKHIDEIPSLIEKGEIEHALVICAFYFYNQYLSKEH